MDKYIGLSNFIELLLTDTLDGVISSETSNIEKINEVKASVDLDDDEFYKLYITETDIRKEILYLFPTSTALVSSIDPGQPYFPQSETSEENPKIYRKLNYSMTQTDYIKVNDKYFITEEGYNNLFNAEKNIYTSLKRTVIRQLISKGIPNLIVDKGQVSSPVNFSNLNISNTYNPYEAGLRYKVYTKYDIDYNKTITEEAVKIGICSTYSRYEENFNYGNTIVFEGYVEIPTNDKYILYLETKGKTLIKLDNKKVLYNYNTQKLGCAINLSQGYHKFYMVCEKAAIKKGIQIYYRTRYMRNPELIDEDMLFYLKEISYKEPYLYNGISGDLQVVFKDTTGLNSENVGQVILYYSINRV